MEYLFGIIWNKHFICDTSRFIEKLQRQYREPLYTPHPVSASPDVTVSHYCGALSKLGN